MAVLSATCLLLVWASTDQHVYTQSPAPVDFARDVQPILRERCYSCHGAGQQMQGLRFDLRRFAMPNRVGANRASIVPGASEASPLYRKLIGTQPGLRMPPDAPLDAAQISLIKTWIDQGADWPDELSGEAPVSPTDPRAAQILNAFRHGDRATADRLLRQAATTADIRGPGGATPLIYAALYGTADSVRLLLERGADPNAKNQANATPLMYALDEPGKVRLLLERGADPNARSDEGQTPLLIAASRPGALQVVKLLLDKGADPSARTLRGATPLSLAVAGADADVTALLIEHGAATTSLPLADAVRSGCDRCADLLLARARQSDLNDALAAAAQVNDVAAMRTLLSRGGAATTDVLSSVALSSAVLPRDLLNALLSKGADVNAATSGRGKILDLAQLQGETPLVQALISAKATQEGWDRRLPALRPQPAATARAAVMRSLPLLDRADEAFIRKAGCVSCHNNALAPLTRATARKSRIAVDEKMAAAQTQKITDILKANTERALQALGLPGRGDFASYVLMGLAMAGHAPDETTDIWARYLKNVQQLDGRWRIQAQRPPLEASDFQNTASAIKALQTYAPKSDRGEYERAIQRGVAWLERAQPATTEDRAFHILGLHWSRGSRQAITRTAAELLADQQRDGGWAQLPTLPSDAYATGQVLVALAESGRLSTSSQAYRRGVTFLLNTQQGDGSWYVRSRTLPVQPHFDSDFPYGIDQFISTAATHWATMALALAAR